MKLNHSVTGQDQGLPILLVHGLFGQGRNLGAIARHLSDTRRVILVDLRNHGDSPHDPDHSYASMAGDLAEVIEAFGGRVDLAGHSMGGKAAMHLALTQPELIRKLVVMDIAPVSYGHSQNHLVEAMQAMELQGLNRRSEADKRLAEHIDDAGLRAFFLQSLDLKSDPPRWRLNLPALNDWMDCTTGWPEGLPKAAFDGPALFMAGAESDYVDDAGEAAIREYFPQARLLRIKRAGHWMHADAPEAVAETLAVFMGVGDQ